MSLSIAAAKAEQPATPNPWILPERTLTVLYGCPEIQRLSHYFLPRILLHQKRVLYLDGANQISPLLIARFARGRGLEPSAFNNLIRIARAFTCFQLTELVRRVPKVLATSSADVLIVTALPDLYFDEDVQDRPARASFEHALEGLSSSRRFRCPSPFFPMPPRSRQNGTISLRNSVIRQTTSSKLNPVPKAPFPLPAKKIRRSYQCERKVRGAVWAEPSLHLFN